ncbi:universal stress protein [Anaeromyxobacter dehalogenans]|uniref:Universal stress protein n=1 Tax=Anaeromyxobacter dehalogenans (strain 2CP-C) TaxID=290397 RepID=Q2IHU3_ANADE|nr:universal stress protein [Anaeromyxobacter dehalogenans]ABC81221.1 universal stress protein UspA [Anaeromyxobacter dehalogenans 2CP-C]
MAERMRICCAIDFSEASRFAMVEATDLARRFEAELELVHVHELPVAAATEMLVPPRALFELVAVDLERDIAAWRGDAERRLGRPVRTKVLAGSPAAEILQHARDEGVDLLVVGTHGRTGLKHLVLGSVAERVVRQAPCSVVVVRTKETGATARTVADPAWAELP